MIVTEAEYIAAVHRREERYAQAVAELAGLVLFALGVGVYELVKWLW